MRTNVNGVTEVAHIRTNLDKFGENYDRIFKKERPLFAFETADQFIVEAYQIAEEILKGDDIIERILDVSRFTYTDQTSRQVAVALEEAVEKITTKQEESIVVGDYYYRNPSVIAMTNGTDRIFINTNGRKNRKPLSYVMNAAHEFSHYPLGFGHGSNWYQDTWKGRMMCRLQGEFADKSQSVPWWLGKAVGQLAIEKGLL